MIILTNGLPQDASGLIVPNGSITFQLNIDGTVIAAPGGFVAADIPIVFQFNAAGQIQPNSPATTAQIYSNKELNPQNSQGLATYYLVTFYDANGARINKLPMWWQFPQAAGATVDISTMTAFATVGGNVIFYPTVISVPPPTPITLGGVFSNVGNAHQWVFSINTDGTVTTTQPAFSDIAGDTNITSAFVVGSGASLDFSGSGTINASSLNGATFASPAAIGSTTPAAGTFTAVTISASGLLNWTGRASIQSTADGIIALENNAGSDFGRLLFGGITSSFPSLKRVSAQISARLADDSADTGFIAATFTATGATPTTASGQVGFGTSAGFGTGSASTAVTTTTKGGGTGPTTAEVIVKYLEIDIAGTKYWIPLVQ